MTLHRMTPIFLLAALSAAVSCKYIVDPSDPVPDHVYANEFELIGTIEAGSGSCFRGEWDGDALAAVDADSWEETGEIAIESSNGARANLILKTDSDAGSRMRAVRCAGMYEGATGVLPDTQDGTYEGCAFAVSDAFTTNSSWAQTFTLHSPLSYICFSVSAAVGSSFDGVVADAVSFASPGAALSGPFSLDAAAFSVSAGPGCADSVTVRTASGLTLGTEPVTFWISVLPCDLSGKECRMRIAGAELVFAGRRLEPSTAYLVDLGALGGGVSAADKTKQEFTYTQVKYKTEASATVWSTASTLTLDGMNHMDRLEGYTFDRWGGFDGVLPESITSSNPSGFWRTGKYKGHHVMVNPDGNVTIARGVNGVTPDVMKEATSGVTQQEYNARFSSTSEWADFANGVLCDGGFDFFSSNPKRLRLYRSFMSEADETVLQSCHEGRQMGHVEAAYLLRTFSWDYNSLTGRSFNASDGSVFALMFDDRYLTYIDSLAKDVAAVFKDSPNFIGYYTDNELQFRFASASTPAIYLKHWLALSSEGGKPVAFDKARAYAEKFMRDNYSVEPIAANVTSAMDEAFLVDVSEYYYRTASEALRRHDPNHLVLGSRLHGKPKGLKAVTAACAKYCDIVSVNVYGVWDATGSYFTSQLPAWAPDKPVWVTEFYTRNASEKYEGVLYGNTGEGGGWIVPSQAARGQHYQNFTRSLLKHSFIAGWQWFQFTDDYLEAYGWNNKGIISPKYEQYTDLVQAMRRLNLNVYQILNYYYDPSASTPSVPAGSQVVWR